MIEHDYWIGKNYRDDTNRPKICVVGFSHYYQPGSADSSHFTVATVEEVVSGKSSLGFFTQIASYFDCGSDFWNRVVFFNFLPDCVGSEEEKFGDGSADQLELGRARALRIMRDAKPDKVLVFTYKGWNAFPPTEEDLNGTGGTKPLGDKFPLEFRWGTYRIQDHVIIACGLRHPQGANKEFMREAVQAAMVLPNY
jgi:hypothetical protein